MTRPVSSGTVEFADVITDIKAEPPTRKEPNNCKRKANHCCAADAVNCALMLSSSFTKKSLLNLLLARIERIVGSPCTEKFNDTFNDMLQMKFFFLQKHTCLCEMCKDRAVMGHGTIKEKICLKRIN